MDKRRDRDDDKWTTTNESSDTTIGMSIEDRRKSGNAESSSGEGTTGMTEQQSKSDRSDRNDDQRTIEELSEWLERLTASDKDNGWNDDGDQDWEGRLEEVTPTTIDQQTVTEIETLT